MPTLTREEQIAAGVTPPRTGEEPRDADIKITQLKTKRNDVFRRRITLSKEKMDRVKSVMKNVWLEWEGNTSNLHRKLVLYNNMMEGVRAKTDFPWEGASNLHIPLIETQIYSAHSVVRSTVLDMDPIWHITEKLPVDPLSPLSDPVDVNIENFLNYVTKTVAKLEKPSSDIIWNAFSTPLACASLDWVEEVDRRFDIKVFQEVDEFVAEFPSPEEAGLSQEKYQEMLDKLISEGNLQIRVAEDFVSFRGPRVRVINLQDLIVVPTTSPSFKHAMFVGDKSVQRAPFFARRADINWFDKEETAKILDSPGLTNAPDNITAQQDRIEGIARNRKMTADEYVAIQGVLKIDLDDDGLEEMYFVTYEPTVDALPRIEEHPYSHNRINYIPFRIKSRPGRLLGMCFYDMLFDLSEEVDTQHNQRINSRTITSVPSFKKRQNVAFDPSRRDLRFRPGVTFTVRAMDDIQMFDIKQTDQGQSIQEETFIFQIAEQLTGSGGGRGGRESLRDPRASGKKTLALLGQSDLRINDYIQELRPGFNELGEQILELYYQHAPEDVLRFALYDQEKMLWITKEIQRSKLRNNNMSIDVARTTVEDNPNVAAQRNMVEYQLLTGNPLIQSNIFRLHAVTRNLIVALRKRDGDKILPPLNKFIEEMQEQQKMQANDPAGAGRLIENLLTQQNGPQDENDGSRQGGPDVSTGSITSEGGTA